MKTDSVPELIRKVFGAYGFLYGTVRRFVRKVVADPRHVRRYCSIGGLMRLVANLGLAGWRNCIDQKLTAELKARGLLVEGNKARSTGRW